MTDPNACSTDLEIDAMLVTYSNNSPLHDRILLRSTVSIFTGT